MAEQQPTEHEHESGVDMAWAELGKFVDNPGLDRLTELYGVQLQTGQYERLIVAEQVAAAHWDYRKGVERQAVDWDVDGELGREGSPAWKVVFNAADKLGMVKSGELQNRTPDYLVILGGANKAPLDRLRFGLGATDDFEHVVYLGSSRPVSAAERGKAKDYAPDAQTEYDLGSGAFETLLGARLVYDDNRKRDDVWGTRVYEFEHNGRTKTGFVLSTPTTVAGRRATTGDNYQFFAGRAELAENPDVTIAAITTGFYVPAQHLAGVQGIVLPYGARLETIGHDADFSGVQRKATQLLQETKSAVDAAARLRDELHITEQQLQETWSRVEPRYEQLLAGLEVSERETPRFPTGS